MKPNEPDGKLSRFRKTGAVFNMIAKTFKGLEEVLAQELTGLGADKVEIQRRAVSFEGDKALLYKANLHLRTASRILVPVFTFDAANADQVYDNIKAFDWEKIMGLDNTFAIDTTVFSDEFRHSKFVAYRAKDAIADRFTEKYGKRPSVSVSNPDIFINIHIAQTQCTVSLDSSGESLHKRGWRVAQTEAPLNEALAAGMLLMAGWKGQSDFYDPMCGSGTLLIEAAMIALNIPPGIYRSSFAFEKWRNFDEELFNSLYNDDSAERKFNFKCYGSDSSLRAIKIAEQNVKSASLDKYIDLRPVAVQKLVRPAGPGLLVTNPPYGERIGGDDLPALYAELGRTLKHNFTGCTAWVISSQDDLLARIGLKPSQRVRLLNGSIDCSYNKYELFDGKRNDYKARQAAATPRRMPAGRRPRPND